MEKGLRELFDEISPIKDFTGKVMELQFLDYEFGEPKYSEEECRTKDLTFCKPLYVNVELLIKETGEIKRQRVYMGDFPWMTDQGTFVINGAERVVVSQLVRSPGVYYSEAEDPATGRMLFAAKVIPNRGAWLEFETSNKDQLWVKVDRKRKIPATTLLARRRLSSRTTRSPRCSAASTTTPSTPYIANTLDKDLTHTQAEALIEVYKKLRPGDPPTGDNARQLRREPVLQLPPLRPRPGRPLQVQQEARRGRRPPRRRAPARAADDHPRGHRGDRRPPHRVQPRAHPRTTSTTSATAASAPTAS